MSTIAVTLDLWDFNRSRTLALLDEIEQRSDPGQVLGWRPGTGRAHVAWQLMHIAVTEELFATERLLDTPPAPEFAELVPRFRGGSTPDDDVPTVAQVRAALDASRQHLRRTLAAFGEESLAIVPEPLRERGWSLGRVLQVLAWHEPHHQGQAHLAFNLWKAQHEG